MEDVSLEIQTGVWNGGSVTGTHPWLRKLQSHLPFWGHFREVLEKCLPVKTPLPGYCGQVQLFLPVALLRSLLPSHKIREKSKAAGTVGSGEGTEAAPGRTGRWGLRASRCGLSGLCRSRMTGGEAAPLKIWWLNCVSLFNYRTAAVLQTMRDREFLYHVTYPEKVTGLPKDIKITDQV